ncbi:MAG TPA: cytochrome c oxidase subunit 3 family protein [Vicinamibacteria bacterium]|nr:cytochrome c oxidase subunit 3 family protein [Vicinamibacteria bacterium]
MSSGGETVHAGATHHPELRHHFESMAGQHEASAFGMWVFIAQEILFFGGMLTAYAIYRNLFYDAFAAGSHHLDVKLGTVNTAVLICSSLTMALGVHAAALGKRKATALFLLLTIVLGSVFLGIKVVEYKDKFEHHLVPGAHYSAESLRGAHGEELPADTARHSEIFFALYFSLTGLHALHMIIGVPIIAYMAWQAWRGRFGPAYYTPVEITGLYWHFVDIVWIFLFPLLYLIPHHA